MKRTLLTAGAVLMRVGAATQQAPVIFHSAVLGTEMPPAPPPPGAKSAHAVIQRLVSFDGNADRRISRDELPERMQGLVANGDRNADAALDSNEISSLVNAASSEHIRVSFRSRPPEGLPDVIKDLKLPPAKQGLALAVVNPHRPPRSVNGPANRDLYRELRALLDVEEYENFVAAATRLSRRPQIIH